MAVCCRCWAQCVDLSSLDRTRLQLKDLGLLLAEKGAKRVTNLLASERRQLIAMRKFVPSGYTVCLASAAV